MDVARTFSCREASTSYTVSRPGRTCPHFCTLATDASSALPVRAGIKAKLLTRSRGAVGASVRTVGPPASSKQRRIVTFSHASRPHQRCSLVVNATAAAALHLTEEEITREGLPTLPRPPALPPAPKHTTLLNVSTWSSVTS